MSPALLSTICSPVLERDLGRLKMMLSLTTLHSRRILDKTVTS